MIKALFFDVDDTLLAFEPSAHQAYKLSCNAFKINYNEDLYQKYTLINHQLCHLHDLGKISRPELMLKRHTLIFGDKIDAKAFNDYFLNQISQQVFLMEDAKEVISTLSKKYKLFIASNSEYSLQNKRLKKAGLAQYFNDIYCSKEIGHAKPEKAFFDYCINASGFNADNIMMIGDNPLCDIQGAHEAKLKTCYFNWKNQTKQQVNCDLEITKLNQLLGSL